MKVSQQSEHSCARDKPKTQAALLAPFDAASTRLAAFSSASSPTRLHELGAMMLEECRLPKECCPPLGSRLRERRLAQNQSCDSLSAIRGDGGGTAPAVPRAQVRSTSSITPLAALQRLVKLSSTINLPAQDSAAQVEQATLAPAIRPHPRGQTYRRHRPSCPLQPLLRARRPLARRLRPPPSRFRPLLRRRRRRVSPLPLDQDSAKPPSLPRRPRCRKRTPLLKLRRRSPSRRLRSSAL